MFIKLIKNAELAAELEEAREALAEREKELEEAREALAEKDRRLKEVELKLLSTTQEMAANAGDYAQQMREKEEELKQCKVTVVCGDVGVEGD